MLYGCAAKNKGRTGFVARAFFDIPVCAGVLGANWRAIASANRRGTGRRKEEKEREECGRRLLSRFTKHEGLQTADVLNPAYPGHI